VPVAPIPGRDRGTEFTGSAARKARIQSADARTFPGLALCGDSRLGADLLGVLPQHETWTHCPHGMNRIDSRWRPFGRWACEPRQKGCTRSSMSVVRPHVRARNAVMGWGDAPDQRTMRGLRSSGKRRFPSSRGAHFRSRQYRHAVRTQRDRSSPMRRPPAAADMRSAAGSARSFLPRDPLEPASQIARSADGGRTA